MRVKKLISFYENQHYFTILFVHNFLSRWLNESFRFFCISYVKILKNWFILVHFTKSLFLFFFVAYRAASILALASSTSEFLIELRLICVVVSEWCPNALLMTDTPDTIASKRTKGNNQSLVVPLCSLYSFWLHHMIVKMALHAYPMAWYHHSFHVSNCSHYKINYICLE